MKQARRAERARGGIYTPAVVLLALTVAVSFLGIGFVMPLRALYGVRIGASSVEIGLMASVALLTGFLAAPAIGWLSDRVGHRTVLWLGLAAHGLLILAYIPISDPIQLIALRGLEGIAIVAVVPPARALMTALAPRSRQGEALGLLSSAQMSGILLGPVIGTLLASQVGYTPSFLVAAIPLVFGALGARLLLPGDRERLAAAATDAGTSGEAPALYAALFSRPLLLAYGLSAVLAVTSGLVTAIWSIFMLARGASLPVIGLSYTTYAIPAALATPFAGRLSDRRGRFAPVLAGLLLYAVIYFLFGVVLSPLVLVLLSGIEGFAAAMARSALDGFVADVMPQGARGKVQANYSAAGTAGSLVAATASGFLYAIGPGVPFVVAGAIFLLAAGVVCLPALTRLFHTAGRLRAA
ncbi:MAG: MFS transporter [Ktedonobacterales bacterium]